MTVQTNPAASMPITMEEDSSQPAHHVATSFINLFLEAVTKQSNDSLLEILVDTINTHIYNEVQSQMEAQVTLLVETKFNALVENRRALHLMDQALETMIDDKIIEAVAAHENDADHHDQAQVEMWAADTARETLRAYARTQEGWVTEDEVKDIITQHVDEEIDGIDWDERVKDVLREML